jgi:colanic acid/amylovoran biosynthesis protein
VKILILNTHSLLNSGDTAIVLAQIQFLRRFFQGVEITLVSRTPRLDRVLFDPLGIKVLPPLIPAPSVFSGRLFQFQESVKNILALGVKSELIRTIKAADLVIASGGGYFWSNRKHLPGPMFLQNLLPVVLAGKMRKSLIFFPQSFGPLFNPHARTLLRTALSGASVVRIFAREPQSRDFALQLLGDHEAAAKVDLAPDLAFLFTPQRDPSDSPPAAALTRLKNMPRPLGILTLRQWDFPGADSVPQNSTPQDEYLNALEEVCLGFQRGFGGSIAILPQVRGPGSFEDDRIISGLLDERLRSELPGESLFAIDLPEAVDPGEVQALIAEADVMIATRFHSAIFALNVGVPVFSIGYQPKSREILKQLGLESFSMPIGELDAPEVLKKIEVLLNRDAEQRAALQARILEIKEILTSRLEAALLPFRQN